jgi:DNA-binding response OmpR family regulator
MAAILVIEPDVMLSKLYHATLNNAGYTVMLAYHAQEAIWQADQMTPALVLLELQLVGHSGIEFLYEFRSYFEWQDVPIILHTIIPKRSLQTQQDQLDTLGVIGYLYKPNTKLNQLVEAVNHVKIRAD